NPTNPPPEQAKVMASVAEGLNQQPGANGAPANGAPGGFTPIPGGGFKVGPFVCQRAGTKSFGTTLHALAGEGGDCAGDGTQGGTPEEQNAAAAAAAAQEALTADVQTAETDITTPAPDTIATPVPLDDSQVRGDQPMADPVLAGLTDAQVDPNTG